MTNFEDPINPEPAQNTFGTGIDKKGKLPRLLLVLALLLITVAVVIAAVMFILKKYPADEQTSTVPQNVVATINPMVAKVEMREAGFWPQTIKVKAGQQVTFVNQDTLPHRIVANEELLNDFDSIDMLTTGNTYTYVFDTPGKYSYYDPADGIKFSGVVEVQ